MLRFQLRPIETIVPWGTPKKPSLSWFALTDGWMVWPVGDQELFRYREDLDELGWGPSEGAPPGFEFGVDYQVARPMEDVGEHMPAWLEPVPTDVLDRIGGPAGVESLLDRYDAASECDDSVRDAAETAIRWCSNRRYHSAHLRGGPVVFVVREADRVRVVCDNEAKLVDGVRVWAADRVDETLPFEEFAASMRSFGDQLFAAMDERIRRIEDGLRHPGVRLRPAALREQHGISLQRWEDAWEAPAATDWDAVRASLTVLDS